MPHYKDGLLANIGDRVFGKSYNKDWPVAGTIVSITPDSEACNCQVAFIEIIDDPFDITKLGPSDSVVQFRNAQGKNVFGKVSTDYGETKAFEKVG